MAGTCANPTCTANGTKYCAACRQAAYCSSTCQKQDWPYHKSACKTNRQTPLSPSANNTTVDAVKIHCKAEGQRYSQSPVPREDPIFKTTPVPISQKIGFPLLVRRSDKGLATGASADNPHATWLMIDPVTGFAPAQWQSGVGNVVVARADGKAMNTSTLAAITDYISAILDAFGNGVGAARKYYDRGRLDNFMADHLKMQQDFKDARAKALNRRTG